MGGLLHCVGKCARGDLRCDASLLERTPLVCGATQDEAHFGMVGDGILRNISIAYSHPRARGIYTKQSLFWDEWHHSLFVHLLLYRSSFLLTHSFKKTITRVATLDVMGYTFAQIKTIPFLVLAFAAAHAHESQFRYQKKNMLIMIWKRHGRVWLFIYVYIRTCAFVRVDLSVRVRLFVDLFMCLYCPLINADFRSHRRKQFELIADTCMQIYRDASRADLDPSIRKLSTEVKEAWDK